MHVGKETTCDGIRNLAFDALCPISRFQLQLWSKLRLSLTVNDYMSAKVCSPAWQSDLKQLSQLPNKYKLQVCCGVLMLPGQR